MGDECGPSGAVALVRTSERLPPAKKSAKIHFGEIIVDHGDVQAVTQPPHQQVHRGADISCKKPPSSRKSSQGSSRRSSRGSSVQGPVLSARHIEEAAGDGESYAPPAAVVIVNHFSVTIMSLDLLSYSLNSLVRQRGFSPDNPPSLLLDGGRDPSACAGVHCFHICHGVNHHNGAH
ncbi:hypothetical protein GDO81_021504 [Engystomops pustulosus]|uniref:Uncharacterized protein n=1 Tax=Engystomops pustulosus TaxID=76066 RepID=A0AAV6ZCA6_ENGPU|nr:hypothetical protein GDO81_021504 [Engystomops pustulosus]